MYPAPWPVPAAPRGGWPHSPAFRPAYLQAAAERGFHRVRRCGVGCCQTLPQQIKRCSWRSPKFSRSRLPSWHFQQAQRRRNGRCDRQTSRTTRPGQPKPACCGGHRLNKNTPVSRIMTVLKAASGSSGALRYHYITVGVGQQPRGLPAFGGILLLPTRARNMRRSRAGRIRPAVVKITLSRLCGMCPISVVRSSRVKARHTRLGSGVRLPFRHTGQLHKFVQQPGNDIPFPQRFIGSRQFPLRAQGFCQLFQRAGGRQDLP